MWQESSQQKKDPTSEKAPKRELSEQNCNRIEDKCMKAYRFRLPNYLCKGFGGILQDVRGHNCIHRDIGEYIQSGHLSPLLASAIGIFGVEMNEFEVTHKSQLRDKKRMAFCSSTQNQRQEKAPKLYHSKLRDDKG